jgi:hypothetical protein
LPLPPVTVTFADELEMPKLHGPVQTKPFELLIPTSPPTAPEPVLLTEPLTEACEIVP